MEIHRSRTVPFENAGINALVFSHSNPSTLKSDSSSLKLFVGRSNGDLECWAIGYKGDWVQETVFHGGKDRSIEGLACIQNPDEEGREGKKIPGQLRLFSIGYSSSVTEWDLARGLPLRHSSGSTSEIWALEAQPRLNAHETQKIITGCADGSLILFDTAENDLVYFKTIGRNTEKKARVLSITWQSRNKVVTGYADSTIRCWDVSKGTLIRSISLGAAPAGAPKETLVWTVKALPNGDIVSGDSLGEIRVYDGKQYAQTNRVKAHDADVLTLAFRKNGGTFDIFSAGMDRRTMLFKLKGTAGKQRLLRHSVHTHHEHDVKAMASFESSQISVIASGGLDTNPVILPMRDYGRHEYRTLPGLPQSPPLLSSPRERLVVSWWDREVRIWRYEQKDISNKMPHLVSRIALKGEENIASASVQSSGKLLAVSTASEVKVFELRPRVVDGKDVLRVRKVDLFPAIAEKGARKVQWSPNGKWLAITTHSSEVKMLRAIEDDTHGWRFVEKVTSLERLDRKDEKIRALRTDSIPYDRTITNMQFSEDSEVFAVADIAGEIDSWVLKGVENANTRELHVRSRELSSETNEEESDEDEDQKEKVVIYNQHWIPSPTRLQIPKLDSIAVIFSFRPSGYAGNEVYSKDARHHHLFILSAKHRFYEFDLDKGGLTPWSKRNDASQAPSTFRKVMDRAMGCVWHVNSNKGINRIWIYGSTWLQMFDLSRDFKDYGIDQVYEGEGEQNNPNAMPIGKKRKLGQTSSGAGGEGNKNWRRQPAKLRKLEDGKFVDVERNETPGLTTDDEGEEDTDLDLDDLDVKAEAVDKTIPNGHSGGQPNGHIVKSEGDGTENTSTLPNKQGSTNSLIKRQKEPEPKKPYFSTFKYRPILGIVELQQYNVSAGGRASRRHQNELEVVLVERPFWDLDLPPRFGAMLDK